MPHFHGSAGSSVLWSSLAYRFHTPFQGQGMYLGQRWHHSRLKLWHDAEMYPAVSAGLSVRERLRLHTSGA